MPGDDRADRDGSIIVVVATDAPISSRISSSGSRGAFRSVSVGNGSISVEWVGRHLHRLLHREPNGRDRGECS